MGEQGCFHGGATLEIRLVGVKVDVLRQELGGLLQNRVLNGLGQEREKVDWAIGSHSGGIEGGFPEERGHPGMERVDQGSDGGALPSGPTRQPSPEPPVFLPGLIYRVNKRNVTI